MKLSEAILFGGMSVPQAFGEFTNDAGYACALMSAVAAIKGIRYARLMDLLIDDDNEHDELLNEIVCQFPITNVLVQHPLDPWAEIEPVGEIIISLNDSHCWTRTEISDWVASIEAQLEPVDPVRGVTATQFATLETK